MGFSTSCKDISIRRIQRSGESDITNLCAYCKWDRDGKYYYSEITLDWHLGIDLSSEAFILDGMGMTLRTRSSRLVAGGSVLICTLVEIGRGLVEISLCLDLCFHNDGGKLVYKLP